MAEAKSSNVAAEEMGFPGRPKRGRGDLAARKFAEDEGLAGLNADAREVKTCAEAGEDRFDEIEFSGGYATGDEEHVSLECEAEGGFDVCGVVFRGGEDEGVASGVGDEGGEHGCVGVADLAGPGGGVNGDELVAGGDDRDARTEEDVEMRVAAGGGGCNLRGAEAGSGGDELVAAQGFGAGRDDVLTAVELAAVGEADLPAFVLNVLQHGDGVGAFGDSGASHDLPGRVGGKRAGGWVAGANRAGNEEPLEGAGLSGAKGETVPGGAGEGGHVAIGVDGLSEDAAVGGGEGQAFGGRGAGEELGSVAVDEFRGFRKCRQ